MQASLHESKHPSSSLLTKLTSFPSSKSSSLNKQMNKWRMRPPSPFAPLFDIQKETQTINDADHIISHLIDGWDLPMKI